MVFFACLFVFFAVASGDDLFFDQRLDHFDSEYNATFRQRYFEYTGYCDRTLGFGGQSPAACPIFLYICGEATCPGIPNDWIQELADHFNAIIVTPEHRYYGQSSPYQNLTYPNLSYLSSRQAINDLAVFRNFYQGIHNSKHGLPTTSDNQWITFGVSYSGGLSSWFRLKFPHLTRGSVSSSGVAEAILAYTAFDEQVATSVGEECASILRETTQSIEMSLKVDSDKTKALFGASGMIDGDFMYLIADAAATSVQYGYQDNVCQALIRGKATGVNLTNAMADYCHSFWYKTFGIDPLSYSQEKMKLLVPGEYTGARQWWFQKCTEMAFFQVAPARNSIRSEIVNLQYHRDLCSNVFSKGLWPDVNATNLYYGGKDIAGTNIFYSRASQDPWQHVSKSVATPSEPTQLTTCHNCAHGVDMRGCPQHPPQSRGNASLCADPSAVEATRMRIVSNIATWLSVK
ncbi:uncharacterized protein [Oscarella lobularis]|uniref:uncharacterized protein n=1 Tax=Oscarella lobularis TaxID=121494 RepID=UPI00331371A4